MKKPYRLIVLPGEANARTEECGSKKTAVKKGDATGESFNVYSPTGQLVHEVTVPVPDQGQATRTGASAKDPVPSPEGVEKTPQPTVEEVALKHSASITLPGNYSIVTAPMVRELAEAYGDLVAHEVRFAGKLERRVDVSSNNKAHLHSFVKLAEKVLADSQAELREWQKEDIERRRGLSDMQKYLEHREFLAEYGSKVARQIKKEKKS